MFVLDTGWYEKTGDWRVNRRRFPDNLAAVKKALDSHGMQLGLWFDPSAAAVTSEVFQRHKDCIRHWKGKTLGPWPIWETEESYNLCLVSRYQDAFADELIRLARETGATYFKWDALDQYGCDSPGHGHGSETDSPEERADCYAFRLAGAMANIVRRLAAACPEAIVDYDITEAGRYVGLGFLASGKYHLVNNGPYFHNLDIPPDDTRWSNVFVHPGPARAWFCRAPLGYDKWIPANLFLAHYLPDDPAQSQWINLASLVLGQHGLWGDLLSISAEGIERVGAAISRFKEVRDDITRATLVRSGEIAGSPEIYEKIAADSGRGAVSLFAGAAGAYSYVTRARAARPFWHNGGVSVAFLPSGHARLDAHFEQPGAKLVFFGVD